MVRKMKLAPIILFAYNRPNHTRRVLEAIASNAEAKDSELHVFIDGPREKKDIEKTAEVKSIVQSKLWCKEVYVNTSDKNYGTSSQIINGVTKFCKERGRAIILEDDIFISPFFLSYMNRALDVYANDERVMEVTGYMFPVKGLNKETGFMRGNCGWGWGTWDRAWRHFEPDGKKILDQLKDKKVRHEFNYRGAYKFHGLLTPQENGDIGIWDIRWFGSIFFNNGLTLFPGKSLVKNIGFDGSGTNIPNIGSFDTVLSDSPVGNFPDKIEETEEFLLATIGFYRSQKTIKALLKKIISRLKRKLYQLNESQR